MHTDLCTHACGHTLTLLKAKWGKSPILFSSGRGKQPSFCQLSLLTSARPSHTNRTLREEVLTGSWGPTYSREWFQNTQTGLLRSSVSNKANSTKTGLCRELGSGVPSLYTIALTTGVLMTGRLGNLWQRGTMTGINMINSHSLCENLRPDAMRTWSNEQQTHRSWTQITQHCPQEYRERSQAWHKPLITVLRRQTQVVFS